MSRSSTSRGKAAHLLFGSRTPVPIPGGSRNNIETMDPLHYLQSSYYEKWLYARIKGLVDSGVLTMDELRAREALYRDRPDTPLPRCEDQERVLNVLKDLRTHRSPRRDVSAQPKYALGDAVRVLNLPPAGPHPACRATFAANAVQSSDTTAFQDIQDAQPPGVSGATAGRLCGAVPGDGTLG